MTIEQRVEITENGVLHLELRLPPEIPVGTSVNVTVTSPVIPVRDFLGGSPRMSAREAIEMGRGIAKRLGSTFTSDRLIVNRRMDKEMEEAKYRRMFHKDEGTS
jgi:hypothetical protein